MDCPDGPDRSVSRPILAHLGGVVLVGLFNLWMIVDAIRQREWIWVGIMLIFPGHFDVLVFFLHLSRFAGHSGI